MSTQNKICYSCDKEFVSIGHYVEQCTECQELDAARKLAESKQKNKDRLIGRIPPLFCKTDTSHESFNTAAWDKIKEHRLTEERPWIGFVGMTGRCKTRMGFLYAVAEIQRLAVVHKTRDGSYESYPSYDFVSSYEIGDAVMNQYSNDFEIKNPAKARLSKIRECEVLLIDDIGKGRLTPAVAAELFAIIDWRHAHLMRTIWTSNSAPEVIAAGLPEDMAGPFAGRLIEMSKTFTFK